MNTPTFNLTKIALLIGTAIVATNAHAVYNLYKKDGLTLDIGGQVDIQLTKQDRQFTLESPMNKIVENPELQPAGTKLSTTDKKPRLSQNHGVSYIDFRSSQELPNDWRATGNIGLGYIRGSNFYLSNSSLSLDKKNVGAISLGRQYLHTNYVNRTGTDTPLDIFSTSALRFDYYGIKGLQASAYYSLAGYNDVTKENNGAVKSGYGASASYRFPMAEGQTLRVAAGYTHSDYNPETSINGDTWKANQNTLNRYPSKTDGLAASLEYQAGKFLVATDIGRKQETMSESNFTPLDKRDTDYLGVKVAYDINPIFQVSAGYGTKKAETKLKKGATPLSNDANALNTIGQQTGGLQILSYVDAKEQYLYDKANTKEAYVQLDYMARPNVRIYGRYDTELTKFKLGSTNTSKISDDNIRAGVVFNF